MPFFTFFGLSYFQSADVIVVQIITLCCAVGAGSYYISGKIVTMVIIKIEKLFLTFMPELDILCRGVP